MELFYKKQVNLPQPLLFLSSSEAASIYGSETFSILEGTLPAVCRWLSGYLWHLFVQIHRVILDLFRDNLEIMYKHLKQEKNLLQ